MYWVFLVKTLAMNNEQNFKCSQCGTTKPIDKNGGTGYATDSENGNKTCYVCMGLNDAKRLKELQPGAKMMLYWDGKAITNWPGTLTVPVKSPNIWVTGYKRKTTHIVFTFEGKKYKAFQMGHNAQVAHVRLCK